MALVTIDPLTGETVRKHPHHTTPKVKRLVAAARLAHEEWPPWDLEDRVEAIAALAPLLRNRSEMLARLISEEMGKPILEARGEVERCARLCEHYASQGPQWLQPEVVPGDDNARVVYEPLGPILVITPWTFPLWQPLRSAVPALLAGNPILLKPANSVMGCGQVIEELMHQAGVPTGFFTALRIPSARIGAILAHSGVAGVALTGRTATGRAVARQIAERLIPQVLELSGNDPFLVFADANLEQAANAALRGRLMNSGQSGISATRILVEAAIREDFEELLIRGFAKLNQGDPRDPVNDVGPLARPELVERLSHQVHASLALGASALFQGPIPEGPGFWYPLSLIGDVRPGMPLFDREVLGPVMPLGDFEDEEEGMRLANASDLGLAASLWTADQDRVQRLIPRFQTGMVFVNSIPRSDPRLPMGGVKGSGMGRELGRDGLLAFTNRKTVWVENLEEKS